MQTPNPRGIVPDKFKDNNIQQKDYNEEDSCDIWNDIFDDLNTLSDMLKNNPLPDLDTELRSINSLADAAIKSIVDKP